MTDQSTNKEPILHPDDLTSLANDTWPAVAETVRPKPGDDNEDDDEDEGELAAAIRLEDLRGMVNGPTTAAIELAEAILNDSPAVGLDADGTGILIEWAAGFEIHITESGTLDLE